MALFVIGDTDLSLSVDKPMDIFGGWKNYMQRLEQNWRSVVGEQDTVVIPGASVVGVTFRQSLFQAFRGNCDLLLDTHSQGRRRHRVRNLRLEEAKALFRQAGIFS